MEALDAKLLRYLAIDTMANPDSGTTPSNINIITLAQMLLTELRSFSIIKQSNICTANGGYFVCAKILANQTTKTIPTIGFIAHMDTSFRYPGTPTPVAINNASVLKRTYGIDLRDSAFTEEEYLDWLAKGVLVSSTPYTILGVKDKAGIAEIMGLVEYLQENPSILHGQINICFTCDCELGQSMDHIEDQGARVQVTSGGRPLWVDPVTGNTTTVYSVGLKAVTRLESGFMDADMAFMVDSVGQTHVQYNNFNVTEVRIHFSGERIYGRFDEEALNNAIKNACMFTATLMNSKSMLTVDSGAGYVFIKSLEGDYLNAELVMYVKDLDYNGVDDMIDEITETLKKMDFYTPDTIDIQRKDIYSNVRNKIPTSMIMLATQSNRDLYDRGCNVIPIKNGYAAADLTTKGIPTISLSCGGYNFYTYQECIPIPALDNCREVLVNIVKNSYDFNFGSDFS